ncbi:hypothetical protein [Brevibacillus borstelensis]|uniref:Uncharacterized protein n=1 Tax=Brevibacillus borstelensis AK1 TaxID=1300222 RepID=M8D1N5_9BACL|nr:hypothetical protein [Brevibacillus borstelensis]EMT50094.1 hypothetical protein I532_24121 [Brevibacillus borstelensis AK1]MBE5395960.1 hypothetical protein [Brevibacillus borstelensis]MED1876902.1 hypothetical protein [Brevibacillus borstelensis]WNF05830.1 hypothetical protein RFB14_26720 [Brevibacillus borstelensis]
MKKIITLVVSLLLIIVFIIALNNFIYFPGFKNLSFDEIITFDKEKISSIYIRNSSKEIHVTDPNIIDKVLNDFTKMEFSKRRLASDVKKSNSSGNKQKYFIELEDNNGDLVEMIYLSGNLFKLYGYSTEETVVYEILNNPELDIDNVFSTAQ